MIVDDYRQQSAHTSLSKPVKLSFALLALHQCRYRYWHALALAVQQLQFAVGRLCGAPFQGVSTASIT
jgi:hypothetical protein